MCRIWLQCLHYGQWLLPVSLDGELCPDWSAELSITAVYIKRCRVEFPRLQHRPVDHFRNTCLAQTRGHCELKVQRTMSRK
ncbi:uncharacterized [Lates japonicus]